MRRRRGAENPKPCRRRCKRWGTRELCTYACVVRVAARSARTFSIQAQASHHRRGRRVGAGGISRAASPFASPRLRSRACARPAFWSVCLRERHTFGKKKKQHASGTKNARSKWAEKGAGHAAECTRKTSEKGCGASEGEGAFPRRGGGGGSVESVRCGLFSKTLQFPALPGECSVTFPWFRRLFRSPFGGLPPMCLRVSCPVAGF